MRLNQSTGRRRVVTCLLTLSLLAFGVPGQGLQRLEATNGGLAAEQVIIIAAIIAGSAVGAYFIVRAIRGRDKPDPPDPNPTSQTRKTDRWQRPLPAWLQSAADLEFGVTSITTAGPGSGSETERTLAQLKERLRQLNRRQTNLSTVNSP